MNKSRIVCAYLFVIMAILTLIARYTYLQTYQYKNFLNKSISNYSSTTVIMPIRGDIVDKNNEVLATNHSAYAAFALAKDLKLDESLLPNFKKYVDLTDVDQKKLKKQLANAKNYDWVIVKDDLSDAQIASLVANRLKLGNIEVMARTKRVYPFNDLYAHSLGYVSRVSGNDKSKLASKGLLNSYAANDYIGKSGLEAEYETFLKGKLGSKVVQTDAYGNEIKLISKQPAVNGYVIKTTLDNELQSYASSLLGGSKGAIVALDPQTGGVLAFVSKPSYNTNLFIDGIDPDSWDELRLSDRKPLLNRATQGTYPPGSTFKPFLALAALNEHVRTTDWSMNDPGYYMLPGSTRKFRDSNPAGFGVVNMAKAIQVSSDAYFYKLGVDMGIDRASKQMSYFGFGSKTGIDLPNELSGLLPTREWKEKRFKNNPHQNTWLPADSVTFGIGQGFNNYTPLQLAYATSIVANNGVIHKPHFISQVLNSEGGVVVDYNKTESIGILPMSQENIQFIKHAMQSVVTSGTSKMAFQGIPYTAAGKTGTAQVVSMAQNSRKRMRNGDAYKDHAWFIAFAPVDNPKIAVAILIENGGWGASAAAPLARRLFDYYLLPHSKIDASVGAVKPFSVKKSTSIDSEEDSEEATNVDQTSSGEQND